MARKHYSDEDVLKLLRKIDVHLHDGSDGAFLLVKPSVSFCLRSRVSLNFSAIACAKSWSYWERGLSDELGDGFEVLEICLEDMICPSALVL